MSKPRFKVSPHRQRLLEQRAWAMRKSLTRSEEKLWREALSGKKLGVSFRRQFVVGGRVVDFAAPAAKVIVEVDGGYHVERRRADARKDRQFAQLGFRVVRLPAELVLEQLPLAVARIRKALRQEP